MSISKISFLLTTSASIPWVHFSALLTFLFYATESLVNLGWCDSINKEGNCGFLEPFSPPCAILLLSRETPAELGFIIAFLSSVSTFFLSSYQMSQHQGYVEYFSKRISIQEFQCKSIPLKTLSLGCDRTKTLNGMRKGGEDLQWDQWRFRENIVH